MNALPMRRGSLTGINTHRGFTKGKGFTKGRAKYVKS